MTHAVRLFVASLLLTSPASPAVAQPTSAPPGVVGSIPGPVPDQPFPPPRDPARVSSPMRDQGAAGLEGRVVDDIGAPIEGATVRVSIAPPDHARETTSDAQGRFEFRGLPGGRVLQVTAARPGFVPRGGLVSSGRSVLVRDGEIRTVDLVLVRPGVIVGQVFDAEGEPVADAQIRALVKRHVEGAARLLPAGTRGDVTDDRGMYRLHSLPPGDYYLLVQPPGRSLGTPPSGGTPGEGMVPTFHPSATTLAEAEPVHVPGGAEVSASVTVRTSALFSISGRVVDAEGRTVKGASLDLRSRGDLDIVAVALERVPTQHDGFTLRRIPPGAYRLVARLPQRSGAAHDSALVPRGEVDLDVSADVDGLVVAVTTGATVRGRITFWPAAPELLSDVRLRWLRINESGAPGSTVPAIVASDGSFEIAGVRGVVSFQVVGGRLPGDPLSTIGSRITIGTSIAGLTSPAPPAAPATTPRSSTTLLPGGGVSTTIVGGAWRTRAVRVHGRDVTNGLDVGQDGVVEGVEIEAARDWATLSGVVRLADGTPAANATLILIPADAAPRATGVWLRPLRGRTRDDGSYLVPTLPAGGYDVVAVTAEEFGTEDADTTDRLRRHATRISVEPLQRHRLDLVVVTRY